MVPRWTQKGPKWSQDGPMRSQDGSKRPQDGPKWPQDGTSPNLGSILAPFGLHFRAPLASQKRPKMKLNFRTIYDAVFKTIFGTILGSRLDHLGCHVGYVLRVPPPLRHDFSMVLLYQRKSCSRLKSFQNETNMILRLDQNGPKRASENV